MGVQLHDQRDHAGAELCAGRPQRVGGLQGVAALDTPPTLGAVADLDVEAAHQRAHRREVFLILRRRAGHFDRAAAVRTARRRRRRAARDAGKPRLSPRSGQSTTFRTRPSATRFRTACNGVYDLTHDAGWVSVGVDHDTASFAVETLRRWWRRMGSGIRWRAGG